MQSTFKNRFIKVRTSFLVFLTHKIGLPYFKLTRKPVHFQYSIDDLKQLPQHTLGRQLYFFLHENHLDLLPYYEKHDIKHVLLDYPPTDCGEVCLQAFMLANGRRTIPVVVSVLMGFLTMPEYYVDIINALKRGYNNISLKNLNWFELIEHDLATIKSTYIISKK